MGQTRRLPHKLTNLAERAGFEPARELLAPKPLSRRPRYDHFGTSPCLREAPIKLQQPLSKNTLVSRGLASFSSEKIFHQGTA